MATLIKLTFNSNFKPRKVKVRETDFISINHHENTLRFASTNFQTDLNISWISAYLAWNLFDCSLKHSLKALQTSFYQPSYDLKWFEAWCDGLFNQCGHTRSFSELFLNILEICCFHLKIGCSCQVLFLLQIFVYHC